MLKQYQLVVFDWEGTIAESGLGTMLVALAQAAEQAELPLFDKDNARLHIRYGLPSAIQKLFPDLSLQQQERLCDHTQTILFEAATQLALIEGIANLIAYLYKEGMKLAVATNKSAQGLARVLEQSGLKEFFCITRSATQAPPKPCPQMLEDIMTFCDVRADQTLMVGDSASDMEMARALGVYAIGMDFFHLEESTLRAAGANDVMQDYVQLLQYIKDN